MNQWLIKFGPGVLVGWLLRWLVERAAAAGDDVDSEGEGPRVHRRRHRVPAPREELKMVLVVNDELKMGKGKIGAQCAHAAVGAVERMGASHPLALRQWEEMGQAKICLRAESTAALRALAREAAAQGLPTFIVQDAGRTQVAAGSRTVLAIGPAPRSAVDRVTGHLKLL